MTQTRNQDRTRTAGADMRQDGMPEGQAPAPRRPETAVDRAKREAAEVRDRLVHAVEVQRPMIEGLLGAYGVEWDFFVSALKVGLQQIMKTNRDFFDPHKGVTMNSFVESIVKCAKDGLMPDGKQAAIVQFAREASYMPMVEGFCHILYQTGLVRDVNHNVVREGDDIDFQEGDDGYVRHRRSLKRTEGAKTIGAWCVINLATGGKIIEICDDKDLADIAKVSRAKTGPRQDWQDEMHRKGPFRRAMKRAPKNARISQLLSHDDANYDLSRSGGAAPAERVAVVPKASLFADKAAVRVDPKPQAKEADPPITDAEIEPVDPQDDPDAEGNPDLPAIIGEMRNAETAIDLADAHRRALALEPLSRDELGWIDEVLQEAKAGLAGDPGEGEGTGDEDDATDADFTPALVAIISASSGPREYASAAEWRDDILTKLDALKGPPAVAFIKTNAPFVRKAMEYHPKEAERVMKVMTDRGLKNEETHHEQ